MFPGFNPRMEEDLSIMTIDNMSKAVLLSLNFQGHRTPAFNWPLKRMKFSVTALQRTVENLSQDRPRVRLCDFRKFSAFNFRNISTGEMFRASRNLSRGLLTISIFYCAMSIEVW